MILKDAEEKHKLEKELVCFVYIRFVEQHFNNTFAILITLMLIFIEHFNIPQLLKQAAEYKLQVKVMKEQEIDMKTQVQ